MTLEKSFITEGIPIFLLISEKRLSAATTSLDLIVLPLDAKDLVNEKIQIEIDKINKNLSKIEKIKKFIIIKEQFTIENGMMTPTLKLKRYKIIKKYQEDLEKLY